MKEINLREFYPWYMEDVMVEVTEEVAEELLAGQRYIKASRRRIYRNKAYYSLDAEEGIEYSACFSNPSPQELIGRIQKKPGWSSSQAHAGSLCGSSAFYSPDAGSSHSAWLA